METLGTALLALAALLAGLAAGSGFLAPRWPRMAAAGRSALHVATLLLAAATVALAHAFLAHDLTLRYVVEHSDRTTPVGYLVAAVWAGQEGSLLLWTALIAATLSAFVQARSRAGAEPQEIGRATAFAAVLVLAFVAILLLYSNPFRPMLRSHPADGLGLGGLLRHPLMMLHPPVIFAGFAVVLVPAVLAATALAHGPRDAGWVAVARPWALAGWALLGLGNLLGMLWAYEELGWGGYWGWDPVENASLLPWLTSTAYLHVAMTTQRRGALLRTTALLAFATATLPVFGTYLTRSGILASQHAFAETPAADAFLILLAALSVTALGLLAWRWGRWGHEAPRIEGLASVEATTILAALVLVVMLAAVAVATMAPRLGDLFFDRAVQVQPEGYAQFMGPLALVLLALMVVCPTLAYRRTAGRGFAVAVGVPAAMASSAALLQWALGDHVGLGPTEGGRLHGYAVFAFPLAVYVTVRAVLDIVQAVGARARDAGEPWPTAARWLVTAGRRRLGSPIAHAGVAVMLAGFAGASYEQTVEGLLRPAAASGEAATATMAVGGYRLTYLGMRDVPTREYEETQAVVRVDEPDGTAYLALPSVRHYHSGRMRRTAEVAIRAGALEDLYLELRHFREEDGGPSAYLRAHVKPLTSLVWTGGGVLLTGALVGLWPTRAGRRTGEAARSRSGLAYAGLAAGLAVVVAWWKGYASAAVVATGAILLAALWWAGQAVWDCLAPRRPSPVESSPPQEPSSAAPGDPGEPTWRETRAAGSASDAAGDVAPGRPPGNDWQDDSSSGRGEGP